MVSEVSEKIKMIIISKGKKEVDANSIEEQTNLIDDLGFDSVQMIEFIVSLEESFGVSLDDADVDLDVLSKYGVVVKMIEKKIAKKV